MQTKRVGPDELEEMEVPPVVHEALASPGRSLDPATRAFMEPRFGHDFSHVRVHTGESAARSAQAVNAHAYTVGNNIVFGRGRFDANGAEGRRLLAHELAHVVQQSAGPAPRAIARWPIPFGAPKAEEEKAAPPQKPAKCDTGCAQHWGRDTTCSKWGFRESVREMGEGKKWRSFPCCNSWPLSIETYARSQGLNGAASCDVRHEKEIATVSYGDKEVQVLCSDTITVSKVKKKKISPTACTDEQFTKDGGEIIELSPKAMLDLSGQLAARLPVSVCYSGSKEELCYHNGPCGENCPPAPKPKQCITPGCDPLDDSTFKDAGWPKV